MYDYRNTTQGSLFVSLEVGTCGTVSIQCCTLPAARLKSFLQVEAISKAMKQRAEDLQLPMPQLVVGQNIETWASPVVYQFEAI